LSFVSATDPEHSASVWQKSAVRAVRFLFLARQHMQREAKRLKGEETWIRRTTRKLRITNAHVRLAPAAAEEESAPARSPAPALSAPVSMFKPF
jgi:hypothetical protein